MLRTTDTALNGNTSTSLLLQTIGYPENRGGYSEFVTESKDLYQVARQNKIGALYVKSLKESGTVNALLDEFEERKEFNESLTETSARFKNTIPNHIDYAVVKTHQPFWADFSDIDILLYDNQQGEVMNQIRNVLASNEYEILGAAPSAMTIRDRATNHLIDIQDNLGLHEVIYFDKETVRDGITMGKIGDTEMPIVSKPDDIAIHINHSITELMFTLKEYYAAVYALESFDQDDVQRLLETVKANHCKSGCGAFFTIVKDLSEATFSIRPTHIDTILQECGHSSSELNQLLRTDHEMPHRYSIHTLFRYTMERFRNPTFAKSVLREIPAAVNPITAYYLLSKMHDRFTREDYTRK